MPAICAICSQKLGSRPDTLVPTEDLSHTMLSGCGHLFHDHCIRQWFEGNGRHGRTSGKCPVCLKINVARQIKKIFVSTDDLDDDDDDDIVVANVVDQNETRMMQETIERVSKEKSDLEANLLEVRNEQVLQQAQALSENFHLATKVQKMSWLLNQCNSTIKHLVSTTRPYLDTDFVEGTNELISQIDNLSQL